GRAVRGAGRAAGAPGGAAADAGVRRGAEVLRPPRALGQPYAALAIKSRGVAAERASGAADHPRVPRAQDTAVDGRSHRAVRVTPAGPTIIVEAAERPCCRGATTHAQPAQRFAAWAAFFFLFAGSLGRDLPNEPW